MRDYSKEEISAIIAQFTDETEYRHGIGKKFLSQSDVGSLNLNPREFRDSSDPPLQAFLHGSYYHEAILEPEKIQGYEIVDAKTRNVKAYKDAVEASGKPILLLKHEKDHLDWLIEKTLANKTVNSLIRAEGNIYEKPGICKVSGEWFKGRADIVSPEYGILDLKTTTDLPKFKYKAKNYFYHAQAYIYSTMFGMEFTFIAVDKKSGNLGIFKCSDAFISAGELAVEKAVENYRKYFKGKTREEAEKLLDDRITYLELY